MQNDTAQEPADRPEMTAAVQLALTGEMPDGWMWNDGSSGYRGALMPTPEASE